MRRHRVVRVSYEIRNGDLIIIACPLTHNSSCAPKRNSCLKKFQTILKGKKSAGVLGSGGRALSRHILTGRPHRIVKDETKAIKVGPNHHTKWSKGRDKPVLR